VLPLQLECSGPQLLGRHHQGIHACTTPSKVAV
jgi:hypothetical protein